MQNDKKDIVDAEIISETPAKKTTKKKAAKKPDLKLEPIEEASKEIAEKPDNMVSEVMADSAGMLAVIEKLAMNPDVDPDKLEKMLNMQERIFDKNAEIAFNKAMVKSQAEIPTVPRDGKGENNHYAKLETMQHKAMPVVSSNGFCLSYGTDNAPSEMEMRITCKLSHADGHSRDYFIDFPRDDTGQKGAATKTKIHGSASALTYGQRYLFKMIFNIQVGGMDQDGAQPAQESEFISEDQAANLSAMVEELDVDKAAFLKMLKVESLSELPKAKFEGAVKRLEAKRK